MNYHVNITIMQDKLEIKYHGHKQCKPVNKSISEVIDVNS